MGTTRLLEYVVELQQRIIWLESEVSFLRNKVEGLEKINEEAGSFNLPPHLPQRYCAVKKECGLPKPTSEELKQAFEEGCELRKELNQRFKSLRYI